MKIRELHVEMHVCECGCSLNNIGDETSAGGETRGERRWENENQVSQVAYMSTALAMKR